MAGTLPAQVVYTENSAAQFNAGTHNSTYVSSSAVTLDYYGRAAGLAAPTAEEWYNGGWKYRLPFTVTSSNGSTLASYPVAVTLNTQALISAGRMNADGSDIRFTTAAAAGSPATLPYYVESGLNTSSTKIWVRHSGAAPGSNSLFMYYGSTSAAAASSMPGVFLLGDNFTAANGAAPSSATWVSIESAAPGAGSGRTVQSNQLRLQFGSPLGTRYYGLRSSNQYSFAAGRQYRADLSARTGTDSWSSLTLCQSVYTYSYDQDDWLRMAVHHAPGGASWSLERSDSGVRTVLASGGLADGMHGVNFLITASSVAVLLDGSQVYAGANTLAFNSPYLYLEAASGASSLEDFFFDNVSVQPYSPPEPAFGSAGTEQGRRYPSGYFLSQIRDAGSSSRFTYADWLDSVPQGSTVTLQMRAHDTNVALATFSAVSKGGDPLAAGRYVQYRLNFTASDPRYSASVSSFTAMYGSVPLAPTGPSGAALSESSIKWSWTDASSGQFQEDGYRVYDASGALKGSAGQNAAEWTETGLYANTQYTRGVAGYNAAGTGAQALATRYTLALPPNLSCDKSTGTWLSGTVTCINLAGFGANGVAYYRYEWNQQPTKTWSGAETQWTAGTLGYAPASTGNYYLHVKSYNGDHVALAGYQSYGPFWYDKNLPAVTGFSPSSAPWMNTFVSPVVSFSDTGGSRLWRARYRWTTTPDRPATGWSAYDYTVSGDSATLQYTQAGAGQWYLHVEADDAAGNTGWSYSGSGLPAGSAYKIDKTNPSGAVLINDGDAYTASPNVTLSLTYSDSESGVKSLEYKNMPLAYSAPELPQATSSWALAPGDGAKTVRMRVTDNAGNTYQPEDSITLDSRTSLLGSASGATASGVMGEAPESFTAQAALSWTPTGAALSGKTVAFHFGASSAAAVTDGLGRASASFAVPASSGPYIYNISFSTDGVYAASSSTGVVTAAQRDTTIITEDVNATSSNPFTAKATLKDLYTLSLITGATVTFVFEGSTLTAVTNGVGVATVTFTAPLPVGFYDYTASYAGGRVYGPQSSVSRIGVGLRVTSLAVPPVASPASEVFNAQATLMDGVTPVAGSTITFTFQGSSNTAVTNALGVAVATFTAPASSGTYAYAAAFPGDGTYAASGGGAALTVTRRPLSLAGETAMGYVNASFTARATLYDGINAQRVPGKTIVFVFEGSSAAVATDALGVSTAVFPAGALARGASCYYYFSGDAGYGPADSTGTVTIDKRPVSLAASDLAALVGSSFTATAQLKDMAFAPAAIAGKTLVFSFGGSSQAAATDALGVASVTYQAGVSTGAYDYYVTFAGDGVYVAGNDTGTVTLDKRPTVLSAYPRFVFAFDQIQVLADLKDGVTGDLISSQTISFNYGGSFQSTTTGVGANLGRAYSVYAGTGVAGSYSYSATFPGTALYAANSSTSSITVTQRSVNLTAFPLSAIWGTTFTATAEFRDGATNALVSAKPVRLAFSTASASGLLTAGGVASSTFTAPASTGTFNWFANFAGDQAYAAAASTGTVTVNRRSAMLTPIATSKYVWDSIFLSASFTDDGVPLAGKQISFFFNGSTLTANTNAGGVATSPAFSSMSAQGVYGFSAQFAGDTGYSAQSGSSTVTVARRPTTLNVGPVSAIANSTVTLSAALMDTNLATGVSGRTVSFTLQSATYTLTAVTNASGVASVVYLASGVTGGYTYSATFAGNANYSGTSSSETLTVTKRPSVLEMADYYPAANSTFTVSAVLKDFASGAYLGSKTVSFLFLGSTRTAVTTGLGYAATSYVTLNSTSSYAVSASYAGDSLYSAAAITKTVFPGRRNTSVQTSDIPTAVAKDTFTLTARLSDYDLGAYLAGSTLTFSFTGSTFTLQAVTNSTGIASVQYAAPAATGTYTYTATFGGSALYNGTLNTSAVTVNRRTAVINPSDLTGIPAASTFTASAVFSDGGLTLSTKTLTFVFTSTRNAVSNGVGVATASFSAPVSTGTFAYKVTYNGDALYNPATAYATVGVVLKPTVLEVLDVPDAVVGLKFTGTAKLRDIEQGNALVVATKTVTFTFRPFAVTYTSASVTSGGVSTTSYIAPLSTGTYGYTATFTGDGMYGPSTSSGTVTVNRRPVLFSLVTNPVTPYAYRANSVNSSFTITATLSDGQVAGLNLANSSITFVFQNSTQTAVTDSLGIASVTFASPASSGTYLYSGYFYGDFSYNPNRPEDSDKNVTIIQRPTNILPRDSLSGMLNTDGTPNPYYTYWNIGLKARVMDSLSGQGIQGVTASFVLLGSTITGNTDSIGTAVSSAEFAGVTTYGTYPAIVRFDGTATYGPSLLPGGTNTSDPYTGKAIIVRSPAYFDVPQITETYPDADTVISANVLDWWNRPVSYATRINGNPNAALVGYPVTYQVSTIPCGADCGAVGRNWAISGSGFVNAVNVATATVHSPAVAGDYPLAYSFPTTNSFVQWDIGGAQRILRVGRRLTYIIPDSEPFTVGAQMPIDITLKLADLTQSLAGINGKNLEVVLVTTQTLVTGSAGPSGKVKATFAGMSVGTYTYIARFADGDPAYMPFSSSGTVVVQKNITVLDADDIPNIPAGNSFQARARLNVSIGTTTTAMAGKTVNFVFTSTGGTVGLSAVTNAVGVATVTFTSPPNPGNYNYTAEFVEDSNNLGSSDLLNNAQVVKRRTQVNGQLAAVYIQESFVSTATLVDLDLANSTVPAKTISFILHGPETVKTAVTNAVGVASVTYNSPASSGTYQYSASFNGDALYALSSDTRTVTVSRRLTDVNAVDLTTPTNSGFTLSATLSDTTFNLGVSTPIAGLQVRFVFNGVTQYGTTGADGKASAAFTAPATAGAYPYSANFDGSQTFGVSTVGRTVTVRKRNTFVSGTDVTAPSGAQFTATANLIDEFGQKLQGFSLAFAFTGTATYNASNNTDANGNASVLFTAPLSTGNYNYTASFGGDATYEASADVANSVTVNVASTTLSVPDGTIVVNNTYYSTATLKGAISGLGIENKQITFTYPGLSLGQSPTDINGLAYKNFTPLSTGTFRLDAAFAGDSAFYAASASATITVTRRTTSMTLAQPVNSEVGAVFYATVTMRDYTNAFIVGKTVDFLFQGTPKSASTNALGVATVTYTAPSPGGTTYPLTASFAGDAVFTSTDNAGIVNVAKRITQVWVDNGGATALDVFNATATLKWGNTPVAGKVIYFTYKGSNLASPPTDASGQAFLQFNAGPSSGPWRLDGAFTDAADSDYAISSGSGTITVQRRSCVVAPDNITMSVYDSFTATAAFRDVTTSSTPAGKFVKFGFNWLNPVSSTITSPSPSDPSGLVYVSSGAPASSGTYKVETFFPGDATYAPSLASTATVTVTRRPAQLSLADAASTIGEVFTATATLRSGAALLDNKYVLFTFEGRSFNAPTGVKGPGIAVATFTVTLATGPAQVDAVFNGDTSYSPSNASSATLTAAMRPTYLTAVAASVVANKVFIATATLRDMKGLTVSTQTVSFTFNGTTLYPVSNAVGVASASFTAAVATGAYSIPVSFAGDFKYSASSTTLALTVLRRPTSLTPGAAGITVKALDVVYATETLRDLDLFTLASQPLRYVFLGSTFNVVTDAFGVASSTWAAPASSGTYSLYAYYDGDPTYANSANTITVTVQQRPTVMAANAVAASALDVFKATGSVTDAANPALQVSARTVTFTFSWSASTQGVTDAVGLATASIQAAAAAGAYTMNASFAGDATFAASSATVAATVSKRNAFTSGVFVSTRVFDVFTASGTFFDSVSSAPVAGRPLSFSLQNVSTQTPNTGAGGSATASFTAPASSGTYFLRIWSPGDATYNATSVYQSSVTLAPRASRLTLAAPGSIIINSTFTAAGTLFDAVSNSTVPSKTLSFLFQASTFTGLTSGLGVAVTGYAASASSGAYALQVSFAGDASYYPGAATMTVTSLRYPTNLSGPGITVVMNEVLTATATLRDYLSANVPSKQLTFSFQAMPFLAGTNASGVAYSTYAASVASGTYSLPVSFAGDSLYDSTSTSLSVLVNKRTGVLAPDPVAAKALDVFTATAALSDQKYPAQKLAGETVQFLFFVGTTTYYNSGVTDAGGLAYSTFTAPASTGTYQVRSVFAGSASYYPLLANAVVTVQQRPVLLMQDNSAGVIDEVFGATATLVDQATLAPVVARSVLFTYGASSAALTGAGGRASAGFTAPSSSGTFQLNSSFAGDATYAAASSTASLTVARRPTLMAAPDMAGIIDEVFRSTLTFSDALSAAKINGAAVNFVFSGAGFAAVTNAAGVAVSSYSAPASSGPYYVSVNYPGGARYLPNSTTAQLLVDRRPAGLGADLVSTRAGEVFVATAALTDVLAPASKPAGLPVRFVFQGSTFTALTDANGLAFSTFTAPASSGTLRLDVSFAGDARYSAAASSAPVSVLRRLSNITIDPAVIAAMDVLTATATLTDRNNPAVYAAGRALTFTFRGENFASVTDAGGVAVSTFAGPASSGTYVVEAAFAGDAIYDLSYASRTITVTQRPAALAAPDGSAYPLETYSAGALLSDPATGAPLPGRDVAFLLDGGAITAPTQPDGVAAALYNTPAVFGPYRLDAAFAGDATYAAVAASATVAVMQRPTVLAPADATITALDVFVASGTLYDVRLASAVAGREIGFTFGAATSTGATSADGLAAAGFTAPVSSGVYYYAMDFAGDSTYAPATSTAAVTVLTRETRVISRDKNANVGELFTLSSQLIDTGRPEGTPASFVPGVQMEFRFKDRNGTLIETVTGVTNELGIATATFNPPPTPDVYYYTARFAGDYTFTASSATAMVKVGLLTSLVAFDKETVAIDEFKVKAKLTDYLSTTLDDKLIRFKFISANGSGLTNAEGESGIAASTFTAPASSGTYFYTAYFDGDAIYSPSNSTGTLVVKLRPAAVITIPASAQAFTSFTVTASLFDPGTVTGIQGRDIDVLFNGSTVTVNTDSSGLGSAVFFAPFSSGTYRYQATFAGDDTYSPNLAVGTVTVSLRAASMLTYSVADLLASSTFPARVQLKDAFNQPIPGLSVDLQFGADLLVADTDAQGYASAVFTAPASSGTYEFYATFYGDDRYSAVDGTGTASVGARPTNVFTSAVSSRLGSPLNLSARLVDRTSQAGVPGQAMFFYYEGSTLTAVTDAFGVSTVTFAAPAATGTFVYGAEFVGDGVGYSGAYSSSPVTIALNLTSLDARGGLALKIYEPLPVEATLRDSIGLQLQGLPVTFVFEGSSATAVTSAVGKATAAFSTALLPSTGTYNYEAYYEGDLSYVASSDTVNSVAVSRREALLLAMNAQATPAKNVLVEARLYDNVNGSAFAGQAVSGKRVSFELNCGTWTQTAVATTSAVGLSTVTFVSPASTGTFVLTASFLDGDPVYLPAASTAALTVFMDDGTGAIRTKLKVENAAAYITKTFVASGTLTATDLPVPAKAVLFEFFNGVATYTAAGFTDAVGLATASFTVPASSGVYQLTASFSGDLDYAAATGTGTLAALRYPDSLTARDVVAYAGDPFWAKAVLRDELTLLPVAGRTVFFEFFNGFSTQTLSAVTSSTGSAEVLFSSAPALAGDYSFTARFDGDAEYVPAADAGSMLIASKGYSTFLRGYEVMVGTGEVFAASATLMTGAAYPVQGKPVSITFQGVLRVSTTGAAGLAVSSFTAPASSGTYLYTAEFSGDTGYNATVATGTVYVVLRKEPDPPVFKAEVTSTTVTLAWVPVSVASASVASYVIEQSASLRGGVSVSTAVAASTAAATCTVQVDENQTTYIKIKTKLDDNQESGAQKTSLIVEIPSKAEDPARVPNYIYMSPEEANGQAAWVKIPGVVMDKISPSAPIQLEVEKTPNPDFLVSYDIKAVNATPALEKELKAVDRRGMKVTIAYGGGTGASASAVSGQRALFWHNGVEWIKIGGELDLGSSEIYTYTRVLGQFALKAAPLAAGFNFTKVAPRIFSPDEPSTTVNRARFYFENPEGAEVTIRIFDVTGALVRRNLESESANIMFWNGKDQAGTLVRGGVYIYQLESGDKVLTGTVVVAK